MSGLYSRAKDLIFSKIPAPLFMRCVALQYYWCAEKELRVLPELVIPGRNALDVGANYGAYSHYLSRLVPHVYAFEPNPSLAARLRKAVRRNVTVVEAGLSDRDGESSLDVPVVEGREIHGHGTLEQTTFPTRTNRFTVRTKRLDAFGYTDIGFMKIDVEGHEVAVLQGGLELVKQCRSRLLVEVEPRHLSGRTVRDVLDFVERLGYLTCVLKGVHGAKGDYRRIVRSDQLLDGAGHGLYSNFIFVPQEDRFCSRF